MKENRSRSVSLTFLQMSGVFSSSTDAAEFAGELNVKSSLNRFMPL